MASLFFLYFWGSLDCGILGMIVRWSLRGCILRAVLVAMMDDTVAAGEVVMLLPPNLLLWESQRSGLELKGERGCMTSRRRARSSGAAAAAAAAAPC